MWQQRSQNNYRIWSYKMNYLKLRISVYIWIGKADFFLENVHKRVSSESQADLTSLSKHHQAWKLPRTKSIFKFARWILSLTWKGCLKRFWKKENALQSNVIKCQWILWDQTPSLLWGRITWRVACLDRQTSQGLRQSTHQQGISKAHFLQMTRKLLFTRLPWILVYVLLIVSTKY